MDAKSALCFWYYFTYCFTKSVLHTQPAVAALHFEVQIQTKSRINVRLREEQQRQQDQESLRRTDPAPTSRRGSSGRAGSGEWDRARVCSRGASEWQGGESRAA